MATFGWAEVIGAALGSGLVIKITEVVYQEIAKKRDRRSQAKSFVEENLDPLLKAADELVGKLRSLAERDMDRLAPIRGSLIDSEVVTVTYLFSILWARIEILRSKSLYVEIGRMREGKRLLQFLDCLESQRVRLIERSRQRAIGELLIYKDGGQRECHGFTRFVADLEGGTTKQWLDPLLATLSNGRKPANRQRILCYGVVLHAFIDTLDPKHVVTRNRPGYANKLTLRSRKDLLYRVFRLYLPFVGNVRKYCEAPLKEDQRGRKE